MISSFLPLVDTLILTPCLEQFLSLHKFPQGIPLAVWISPIKSSRCINFTKQFPNAISLAGSISQSNLPAVYISQSNSSRRIYFPKYFCCCFNFPKQLSCCFNFPKQFLSLQLFPQAIPLAVFIAPINSFRCINFPKQFLSLNLFPQEIFFLHLFPPAIPLAASISLSNSSRLKFYEFPSSNPIRFPVLFTCNN